jgi:hypothetical protein
MSTQIIVLSFLMVCLRLIIHSYLGNTMGMKGLGGQVTVGITAFDKFLAVIWRAGAR